MPSGPKEEWATMSSKRCKGSVFFALGLGWFAFGSAVSAARTRQQQHAETLERIQSVRSQIKADSLDHKLPPDNLAQIIAEQEVLENKITDHSKPWKSYEERGKAGI